MNVGIVGCGLISRTHVKSLLEIEKCKIVSVCDLIEDKASALAREYNIPGVYTDFSLMLQKEKLDVVHVLTPPQAHAPLAIEAINAGCHVLVEKPMCMTVKEADEMIETAKRNDVKLGVIHSFLFTPAIRESLDAVRKGEIGEPLCVDTIASIYPLLGWPRYERWYHTLQGGLFGEIMPHALYVQLAFLGKIEKIFGVARQTGEVSDLLPFSELQVLMKSGKCTGGLLFSSRIKSNHVLIYTRIIGSKKVILANVPTGTITITNLRGSDILPIKGGEESLFTKAMTNLEPAFQLISKTISQAGKVLIGAVKPQMTHKIIIKEFIESIEKGTEPPVTGEEGREVIKATNMLWENIVT